MVTITSDNEISKMDEKKSPNMEDLESSATYLTSDITELHPKPVPNDPLDPLNWSTFQKHTILAIVMALYVYPSNTALGNALTKIDISCSHI